MAGTPLPPLNFTGGSAGPSRAGSDLFSDFDGGTFGDFIFGGSGAGVQTGAAADPFGQTAQNMIFAVVILGVAWLVLRRK
tara:strand:+ start:138 stop:377 length:240 start_codon:yes stop_codon:yes gene_type:complete